MTTDQPGPDEQAILQYIERFGEGPPIWGMPWVEALAAIERAIETGQPMEGVEPSLPDDAFL